MYEKEILDLVRINNPEDPIEYVTNIVKCYSLQKLNESIIKCNKCKISDCNVKSITYGNTDSDILIISDMVTEEQYNKSINTVPLLDSYGKIFENALEVIQQNKKNFYYINAVNCFPYKSNDNQIFKRNPTKNEKNNCRIFIDKIINIIKPKIIITLGSIATNTLLLKNNTIIESRGKIFFYNGYKVMPTFNPSFFKEIENLDEDTIIMYKDLFLEDIKNAIKNVN